MLMAVRGGTGLATSCETSAPNEAGQDPTKARPPLPLSPPPPAPTIAAHSRGMGIGMPLARPHFLDLDVGTRPGARILGTSGPRAPTSRRAGCQVKCLTFCRRQDQKPKQEFRMMSHFQSDRIIGIRIHPSYLRDRGPPSSPPPLILVPQTAAQACGRDRSIRPHTRSGPRDRAQFWFSPVLLA